MMLHHGRRDGGGRAGQGHASIWVDNRDDLAGTNRIGLLEAHLINITGMNVRVGRSRRQGDGWSDLLDGLNLMLERRGIGRATREG